MYLAHDALVNESASRRWTPPKSAGSESPHSRQADLIYYAAEGIIVSSKTILRSKILTAKHSLF